MIPATHTAPLSPPILRGECKLQSRHTPAGHLHFFIKDGLPVSCCAEPRGISRVFPRPAEIHPASFTYHDLRFEALRVGGTMIIVRDNREVLEEIYLDKHLYLLANGIYTKVALTNSLRNIIHHDYTHQGHHLLKQLF